MITSNIPVYKKPYPITYHLVQKFNKEIDKESLVSVYLGHQNRLPACHLFWLKSRKCAYTSLLLMPRLCYFSRGFRKRIYHHSIKCVLCEQTNEPQW